MNIKYIKDAGGEYLKICIKNKWIKLGKDKRHNWFMAVGNDSGIKWANHSRRLWWIIKNIPKTRSKYKSLHA